MSFIYHSLHTVTYILPSILPHISVLYDGGASGFSLAMVIQEGLQYVAMRWNVAHKQQGRPICTGFDISGCSAHVVYFAQRVF